MQEFGAGAGEQDLPAVRSRQDPLNPGQGQGTCVAAGLRIQVTGRGCACMDPHPYV
jgi:hypothetical protein